MAGKRVARAKTGRKVLGREKGQGRMWTKEGRGEDDDSQKEDGRIVKESRQTIVSSAILEALISVVMIICGFSSGVLASKKSEVASALHNLGQFYLVQRKLKDSCNCYETYGSYRKQVDEMIASINVRALKIKGRVLGYGHVDYADTMYHLGTVLYLLGEEKDSMALIQDSIRILEEGGLGESILCIRRLRYLAKMHMKSNNLLEAENVQRKILHIMELSKHTYQMWIAGLLNHGDGWRKFQPLMHPHEPACETGWRVLLVRGAHGWNSLETINSADGLALTLYANGCLKEAQELLERCLDARKSLLPEDHIQIGANMLHLARVVMLSSNELKATDISKAVIAINKARELLNNSIRISRGVLNKISEHGEKKKNPRDGETGKDGRTALIILLQSLDSLGHLEITVQEMQVSKVSREGLN
ncbi:unnamed protein product [Citrullus colocynthis]|uniref:Uncharacterized protein n=1 Tax=Citrullus colocynthis TaxID=252529 RepID=A0ABP0YHC6_9ROSI